MHLPYEIQIKQFYIIQQYVNNNVSLFILPFHIHKKIFT